MRLRTSCLLAAFALCAMAAPKAQAGFDLGAAGNYAVVDQNTSQSIQLNRATITGNVAITNPTGQLANTSNGFVVGNVDFAGAVNETTPANVSGKSTGNVDLSNVLNALATLSSTTASNAIGAPTINLSSGQTVDITTGKLVGNTYYFNIGSVNLSGATGVTISGANAPAGYNVAFNDTSNLNINGAINLAGGLTSDMTLFNVVGGKSIVTSVNGGSISGIFLDPNGTISIDNTNVMGRVFGGDNNNLSIVSGSSVTAPAAVPEPSTLVLAGLGGLTVLGASRFRRRPVA